MKLLVTVALLSIIFLVTPVYASNVTIKVESVFLQPLENCFIILDGIEGVTDTNGTIVFQGIESGNYSLRVVRQGQIQESSVLVQNADVKKNITIVTQDDWQIISFLGLIAVVVIALALLFSRIDRRKSYDGGRVLKGEKWKK
jgi:hypothetical protein